MTGSPLLRFALVLAALALLAIPAWRLTGREAPPMASAQPGPAKAANPVEPTEIIFTAATPPTQIEVQLLGKTILTLKPTAADFPAGYSASAPISLARAESDLVFRASWSGTQAMNALRVQIGSEMDTRVDTTLWGTPQVEDAIIVPGRPAP